MTGTAHVVKGDALNLPLPDESVDLIVTSPPYFSLRSYTDDGEHYDGQVGAEDSWRGYLDAMLAATREMVRVLKSTGSIFVNLGDKYAGSGSGGSTGPLDGMQQGARDGNRRSRPHAVDGIPEKSLMLLPERYRIRCVDDLGLVCRSVIVWDKPNGLPESVTDRVRRSHEDWVHLTRQPRYYAAVDEIRQPHARDWTAETNGGGKRDGYHAESFGRTSNLTTSEPHALGALPPSVWTIPTEPLNVPDHLGVEHFAAFPTEWPRRLVMGFSPPGICVECGTGRRPVNAVEHTRDRGGRQWNVLEGGPDGSTSMLGRESIKTITGYACGCDEPTAETRPSVVLDPFGGTGTVALAAKALGRIGITVDLSTDYCRLAEWRTTDPNQLGKVRGRFWADRQETLDFGGAA